MTIRIAIPIPDKRRDLELAHALLSLLAHLDEGIENVEYLLVCDDPVSEPLRSICNSFLARKSGRIHSSGIAPSVLEEVAARIGVPRPGSDAAWSHARYLAWNVVVDNLIRDILPNSDFLLLLEPDACILRNNWLRPIVDEVRRAPDFQPIVGHLKEGIIRGERVVTHWAGCSCLKPNLIESIGVDDLLAALVPNPWHRYREELGNWHPNIWTYQAEMGARYCSLDLVFYVMFWNKRTGSAIHSDWHPEELLASEAIRCAFGTSESWSRILNEYYNRLSIFHHQKTPFLNRRVLEMAGGTPLPCPPGIREGLLGRFVRRLNAVLGRAH